MVTGSRSLNVARICSARHDSASRGISVDTPSDTVGAGGFHQLGVPSHCIGRLQRAGFVKPLAVQQAFVPNVLKEPERDFVLHAETGLFDMVHPPGQTDLTVWLSHRHRQDPGVPCASARSAAVVAVSPHHNSCGCGTDKRVGATGRA